MSKYANGDFVHVILQVKTHCRGGRFNYLFSVEKYKQSTNMLLHSIKSQFSLLRVCYLIALILGIWTCLIYYDIYITIPEKKKIIRLNMDISNTGKIQKIGSKHRVSASTFEYRYYIEGKKYLNKISLGIKFQSHGSSYLMNRTLPVAYEKGNPNNSWLLIKPNDFEYFNLPFPDSLNWIKTDVIKDL